MKTNLNFIMAATILLLLAAGCSVVKPGYNAMRWKPLSKGLVTDKIYSNGVVWHWPWNGVVGYNMQWQTYNENVSILTEDELHIDLTVSVTLRPVASELPLLELEVGKDYYKGKLVRPEQTLKEDFLNLAVFEYMIGNTDWSVQYLQNVKLIASDSLAIPSTVPYDFDHAGIVGAPYALPAAELLLTSTKERRYRGYCINDMNQFTDVIAQFNMLKDTFYNVYTSSKLLEESYLKSTVKFLDDFYKTINDPKRLKNEFQYPCNPDGTGNVVIRGLKKN